MSHPPFYFFFPSDSNQTDCPRLNLFIHIFLAAVDADRRLFLIWIVSSQILFFNKMFDMTYAPLSCIVFSWTVGFIPFWKAMARKCFICCFFEWLTFQKIIHVRLQI
jgi:hypothetical protein